ncbi:MAG: sugar transferase, partial [Candidatus Eremiobacterota bacterium]
DLQKHRHDIRPGLSSLAAINGRNALTWEKKFEYDIAYINNISFKLDMRIIFTTIWVAIKREGINQEACATADEFTGS